jgi:hypothetical protein
MERNTTLIDTCRLKSRYKDALTSTTDSQGFYDKKRTMRVSPYLLPGLEILEQNQHRSSNQLEEVLKGVSRRENPRQETEIQARYATLKRNDFWVERASLQDMKVGWLFWTEIHVANEHATWLGINCMCTPKISLGLDPMWRTLQSQPHPSVLALQIVYS